jgi:hypothetical protein
MAEEELEELCNGQNGWYSRVDTSKHCGTVLCLLFIENNTVRANFVAIS